MRSKSLSFRSLPLLIAFLLVSGCKQNSVGPTETQSQPPPLSVSPSIGYVNKPILFTATVYPDDSTNKAFIWQFSDRTDTIYSKNTISKTFSSPGKYGYIVSAFHYTKYSHALIARDTGTFTVYAFSSSIKPSHLHAMIGSAYTFQVHSDSFSTSTNYKYTWKIGDSVIVQTGIDTINFVFRVQGIFPIQVQIEDAQLGVVSFAEDVVAVGASFQFITINPRIAIPLQDVHFKIWHSALQAQHHFVVTWDFGDGPFSSAPIDQDSVVHAYLHPGRYRVIGRVTDAVSKDLLFTATDTAIVSPLDPSALKLTPRQTSCVTGSTILFTAQHPVLDTKHTYHWQWQSDGDPQQVVRTTFGDTASFIFNWTGSEVVSLTLIDDVLNMPVASDTAHIGVSAQSGFSRSLIGSMTSMSIEFVGHNVYSWAFTYVPVPGNGLSLSMRDAAGLVGHINNDTISLGYSYSTRLDTSTLYDNIISTGDHSYSVVAILSTDGKTCLSTIGKSYWDQSTTDFPKTYGGSNYSEDDESSALACHDLFLISFSKDSICYGLRGDVAKLATDTIAYKRHNALSYYAHAENTYQSTDWTKAPTPQVRLVFRR